jgi:hypothetical protein
MRYSGVGGHPAELDLAGDGKTSSTLAYAS